MGDVRQPQQTTQGGGAPPGTPIFVDIYAVNAPGGGISWSHEWRFRNYSKKAGAIVVPRKDKGQDGTPIHFEVHDGTEPKVGLRFVNGDDAIWVNRDSCPETTASSDPEITDISPSGKVLRVLNLNQVECTLHYNLRFEPDPNRYYYDPEIRNGGTTAG